MKGSVYLSCAYIVIAIATLLSGCTTFRGPGPLQSNQRYRTQSEGYRAPHTEEYIPQSEFSLDWPVKRVQVSQTFRPRRNRSHQGLDIRGQMNTPIFAAHEGRVIYTGDGFSGYGNMVMIEYDNQWATLYAHLNRIEVREGQVVFQGEMIGLMGRTGRTTGVHLHFELIKNKRPVDPLQYLREASQLVKR